MKEEGGRGLSATRVLVLLLSYFEELEYRFGARLRRSGLTWTHIYGTPEPLVDSGMNGSKVREKAVSSLDTGSRALSYTLLRRFPLVDSKISPTQNQSYSKQR
jgi:hypothetical protein